jgi:tetratricopeptide (TPR) repeat protein
MNRLHRLLSAVILSGISAAYGAGDEDSIQQILDASQRAMLGLDYGQAVHILRNGLKGHPEDNRLRLELGRAYLSAGSDNRAIRLFREILTTEPYNRLAVLELARALSYKHQYADSNELFRKLLSENAADEAASIGLASNLLHQQQPSEAQDVIEKALKFHPNSLRLQEYQDRIEGGLLSGDEREVEVRPNSVETAVDYVNDSVGNHSWRSSQRADFVISPSLTTRLLLEQQWQHSLDDPLEVVQTFSNELHWRPREFLLFSAGGGAVWFNNRDVNAIYETSFAFQPMPHLLLGAGFSRVPVAPSAEATENRLTAQGWETFGKWTPGRWRINANWLQQHYSDENIGSRRSAEVIREWRSLGLTLETGYRYRHLHFEQQTEHGYFSPDSYQSHLAIVGVLFHSGARYRNEFLVRSGVESIATDSGFHAAWEIHSRNEFLLGRWTLELDYSKYHLVQSSGALRADAGQLAFIYHF